MSSLQPFDFEGTPVRTITFETGVTWWVLSDVAKSLDVQNTTDLAKRLDEDERSRFNLGRQGEAWIINESGLYDVILRSDKPKARRFRKWVTGEVLPSIRKHGAYMSGRVIEQTLTDPDYLIRLATTLKEEKQARALAESQVRQLAPKAQALDDFTGTKGAYGVSEAAKILANSGVKIGPRGLFELLCEMGWIYRKESHWMAKADRVASGHLMMHDYRSEGQRRDGSRLPFFPQVRVTRKGMELLHRRLTEHQIDRQLNDLGRVA